MCGPSAEVLLSRPPPRRDPSGPAGLPVAWSVGLAATMVGLAAVLYPPSVIPETLELIATGRCLLGLSSVAPACSDFSPWFWSPGWPVLVGALSTVLPPLVAGGLVSAGAFGALVVAAGRLGRQTGGMAGELAAMLAVGLVPSLEAFSMAAEGRTLALALLAWALVVALEGEPGTKRSVGAGLLAGLAAVTRPEALIGAAGVGVLLGTRGWRQGVIGLAMAELALLPVHIGLSLEAGRPTLMPRSVQWVGFALAEVLPEAWARLLIGNGSWRLPLRDAILAGPWPEDLPPGADLAPGLLAFVDVLTVVWHPAGLALALGGAAMLARSGAARPLLAISVLAAPAAVVIAVPSAVDMLQPEAYVLPMIVAVQLLAAALVARLAAGLRWPARSRLAAGSVVAALLGLWQKPPWTAENLPEGPAVVAALRAALPPGSTVVAGFEASPVVHLAGMRWLPWPAPWEPARWTPAAGGPVMAVVPLHGADWNGLPPYVPDTVALRPVATYGRGPSSMLLLSVESRTP